MGIETAFSTIKTNSIITTLRALRKVSRQKASKRESKITDRSNETRAEISYEVTTRQRQQRVATNEATQFQQSCLTHRQAQPFRDVKRLNIDQTLLQSQEEVFSQAETSMPSFQRRGSLSRERSRKHSGDRLKRRRRERLTKDTSKSSSRTNGRVQRMQCETSLTHRGTTTSVAFRVLSRLLSLPSTMAAKARFNYMQR